MITIDGFLVDAAITEDHTLDSDVTTNPVEDGADVTDNIRPKPVALSLECLVSDSPSNTVATLRSIAGAGQPPSGVLPSADAYAKLLEIRKNREPVTVITPLATYENMAMMSLGIPRTAVDGLRFRVSFQQVEIVQNERTVIKTAVPRSSKKKKRGNRPSADATSVPTKALTISARSGTLLDKEGQFFSDAAGKLGF